MNLEKFLVGQGLVTEDQILSLKTVPHAEEESLLRVLVRSGTVDEAHLLQSICKLLNLEFMELHEESIDLDVLKSVPAKVVVPRQSLPVRREGKLLIIAVSDPFNLQTIDELRLMLDCDLKTVVSTSHDIDRLIKRFYGIGAESMDQLLEETGQKLEVLEDTDENGESLEMVEDASLIQFVNQIIIEAVRDRASDIHIEPWEDDVRIRYRIDGMLYPAATPPRMKLFQQAIISRIKIMADLNIAEKRLPQDGRIKLRAGGREIDVRVSIIPGIHGEGIVMRLLDRGSIFMELEALGMDGQCFAGFNKLITRPHGIILVTGPTGSGKSTTLYGSLHKINTLDKKIITIEDPVEYQLSGIFQIPTKPKIGFDFAQGLRSILRHDPDIIMVGEIRDRETADISIRSALTGHLVFSTLHTNDAAGGLTRLVDMGIEPYLVASSVEGLMAQRLVRHICQKCKEPYEPQRRDLLDIEGKEHLVFYHGAGCESCRNTGYKGRIGIFELLMMDDPIREMIMRHDSAGEIKQYAVKQGMKTLWDDGIDKVRRGLTTIEEVLRVSREE